MMDLNDTNRPVRLKFRFNEAEADALGDLASAKGLTAAALVRQWLHAAIHETDNPAPDKGSNEGKNHANDRSCQ